jgi:hypothetical protein
MLQQKFNIMESDLKFNQLWLRYRRRIKPVLKIVSQQTVDKLGLKKILTLI